MAKFIIKVAKNGCKFDFLAEGHTLCTSQVYNSELGCKNGIESVKKNAALDRIEDITIEGVAAVNPKFQIYKDKAGGFRFRLCASNGKIIAVSEDFKAKEDCIKVIKIISKQAPKAKVEKA